MDRTFRQRITIGAVCGIILFLALAVYAFWIKSVILGLLMVFFLVIITERTLHTEYVFRDGTLIISHGRLSKDKRIPVACIRSCRPMRTVFGLVRYLLISYGSDKDMVASVQPDNEQAFVDFLRKKLQEERRKDEV